MIVFLYNNHYLTSLSFNFSTRRFSISSFGNHTYPAVILETTQLVLRTVETHDKM
jgi:hypothetical protein